MPRPARSVSVTGIYHVYSRGNSRQIIFEDDSDRYRFLEVVSEKLGERDIDIIAWCLMDNHFHFLVDDPDGRISNAMQAALTSYVKYFNRKSGRSGHLFDDRFKSEPVETDSYALTVVDYIHLNPVKGILASLDTYRWSSYRSYAYGIDSFGICDPTLILDMAGGSERYRLNLQSAASSYLDGIHFPPNRIPDEEVLEVARELLDPYDPTLIKGLDRKVRNQCLLTLRRSGLVLRQISRLTGMGESTISFATKGWKNGTALD